MNTMFRAKQRSPTSIAGKNWTPSPPTKVQNSLTIAAKGLDEEELDPDR
jgi:hypothetical protein